jgi:hypothetical protein
MKPIHLDREQTMEIERRRHETHDRRIYERLSAVGGGWLGKPQGSPHNQTPARIPAGVRSMLTVFF